MAFIFIIERVHTLRPLRVYPTPDLSTFFIENMYVLGERIGQSETGGRVVDLDGGARDALESEAHGAEGSDGGRGAAAILRGRVHGPQQAVRRVRQAIHQRHLVCSGPGVAQEMHLVSADLFLHFPLPTSTMLVFVLLKVISTYPAIELVE